MIRVEILFLILFLYIAFLFVVGWYADRKRAAGESIVANSFAYTLSITVLYSSYTFYGMVGRAATSGIEFLADAMGATLVAFTWWILLRKMVRISKKQNILTLADFIASRYGNSALLGALVTVFSLAAFMPMIALQLKAVSHTFDLITGYPSYSGSAAVVSALPSFVDTALLCSLLLGLSTVLLVAKRAGIAEPHDGLVAVVAVQGVVKLVALLAVGVFVTYGLFHGFTDIFSSFVARFPERRSLFTIGASQNSFAFWCTRILIDMSAVVFIPRQFHVMVYLIVPILLKISTRVSDLSGALLGIRRTVIFAVVLLGYLSYRVIGDSFHLVSMGVISSLAASQFAPAIIGGLYWKHASRRAAAVGLVLGGVVWCHTLLAPVLVEAGFLEKGIQERGPFGLALLRPLELFGLTGLDMLSHAFFWTMFFNVGAFLFISLMTVPDKKDEEQGEKFVDVFEAEGERKTLERVSKPIAVEEFIRLMAKFIGEKQAQWAMLQYMEGRPFQERGQMLEY